MRVLVSGSSGLIGSALTASLAARGDEVIRLVRRVAAPSGEVRWNPAAGEIDLSAAGPLDAVVHLAGDNVASSRWNDEKRGRIRSSRVDGTRLLAQALAALPAPPKVFASASAIGYYGDRGDQWLNEDDEVGEGFLAQVCHDWETAALPAVEAGLRVARLRIGLVLAARGGPLAQIVGPFRWGLGGRLGDGRQYMSWITLDDVVRAVECVLSDESFTGAINLTAPRPVTNREFTQTLGAVLHRPTFVSIPASALRWMFGDMADELFLASARVEPRKLLNNGFTFADADLLPALRRLLGG